MTDATVTKKRLVLLTRYLRDGSVLGVWRDEFKPREHGLRPRRASRIEVVESGPFAGLFYTTILIGQVTGDPAHDVSLWPPLGEHRASVLREQEWLARNYVLGG